MWNSAHMRIFALCFLFFIFSTSEGYTQSDKSFKLGLRAGLNASQIWGDGYAGFNKIGGYAGLGLQQSFGDSWTWGFDMLYHNKGSVQPPKNAALFYKIALHYVEVPIVFNYEVADKFYVEGGAVAGFLFSQRFGISRGSTSPYLNPPFRNYEIGILIGGGYQYSENIRFTLRSQRSVVPIAGNLPIATPGVAQSGIYNLNISLGLLRSF